MFSSIIGNKAPLVFRERRKWDTKPRLLASIEKAGDLIGYEPIVEFEEGFEKNIDWFRDNWGKVVELADFPPGMNSAVRDTEPAHEKMAPVRHDHVLPIPVVPVASPAEVEPSRID